MQRRGFLRALLGGAAIAADPERLLWEPGKRLISIPGRIIVPPPAVIDFDRYITDVAVRLANEIERRAMQFAYSHSANIVGALPSNLNINGPFGVDFKWDELERALHAS